MVTFFVKYIPYSQVFYWTCYSGNNRELFRHAYEPNQYPKHLRNCVNHIKTIGKQLHSYSIHITAEANEARKKLGEPLYGCYAATER